jgi:hypothetical protein
MGENKILGEDPNPLPSTPTTLPGIIDGWFTMIGTAQAGAAQKNPNRLLGKAGRNL